MSARAHALYFGVSFGILVAVSGYLLYLLSVPAWALCLTMAFFVLCGTPMLVWAHQDWVLENVQGAGRAPGPPTQDERGAIFRNAFYPAYFLFGGVAFYFLENSYLALGFLGIGLALLPRTVRKIRHILASARSRPNNDQQTTAGSRDRE